MDLREKITENIIQCSHWKWEKVTKECVKDVKNAKNEQDVCEKWLMKDKLFNQYEVLEIQKSLKYQMKRKNTYLFTEQQLTKEDRLFTVCNKM